VQCLIDQATKLQCPIDKNMSDQDTNEEYLTHKFPKRKKKREGIVSIGGKQNLTPFEVKYRSRTLAKLQLLVRHAQQLLHLHKSRYGNRETLAGRAT
jgi:hypothetical protein